MGFVDFEGRLRLRLRSVIANMHARNSASFLFGKCSARTNRASPTSRGRSEFHASARSADFKRTENRPCSMNRIRETRYQALHG